MPERVRVDKYADRFAVKVLDQNGNDTVDSIHASRAEAEKRVFALHKQAEQGTASTEPVKHNIGKPGGLQIPHPGGPVTARRESPFSEPEPADKEGASRRTRREREQSNPARRQADSSSRSTRNRGR
jgi:hypothetical protein